MLRSASLLLYDETAFPSFEGKAVSLNVHFAPDKAAIFRLENIVYRIIGLDGYQRYVKRILSGGSYR
jgi:hypothetical protein